MGQTALVARIGVSHEVDGRHRLAIVLATRPHPPTKARHERTASGNCGVTPKSFVDAVYLPPPVHLAQSGKSGHLH